MGKKRYRLLYIHGMGGGSDSRIPSILSESLSREEYEVFVRTYDFAPSRGREMIDGWVRELCPDLIVGESLGAVQASRVEGIPHILVSPSLGAPFYLGLLSWMAFIPGATWLLLIRYLPMLGVVISFKNYRAQKPNTFWNNLIKSEWVGLKNFEF